MTLSGLPHPFNALLKDLLADEGPRISTMRNYRFAILPYLPAKEFETRRHVRRLSEELRRKDWEVLDISMHHLFMQRLRGLPEDQLKSLMDSERRLSLKDPLRPLNRIRDTLAGLVEGETGLAADVVGAIQTFNDANPGKEDSVLIWISRLGAVYPFLRASTLLRYLDGKTHHLPVVLLYPGEQRRPTALSFMGELEPDRDYRPRIYGSDA